MNQDELRDFLHLSEKHRAAYSVQPNIPDDIRNAYLKELDDQIADIKSQLVGALPTH